MTDLLTLITARLATVLAGHLYPDPTGGTRVPRVYTSTLPAKRATGAGEDFPFVLVRIVGGIEELGEGSLRVHIIGGLYSSTTEADGNSNIMGLAGLLLGILGERAFSPYKLALPAEWWLGDKEHGVQPHPEYYVTVELRFKRAPTAKNRR